MKMFRILASALAVLSLAGTTALAQGAPRVKKACAADRQKLCPGIDDRHAMHRCMIDHMADISPDCQSAMAAAKAAHHARMMEAAKAQAAPPEGPAAGPPAASPPPVAPH